MSPPPPPPADAALFLDFDGTLVELAPRPDAVVVDDGLVELLGRLARAWRGRVAVISGRSIAQLDRFLGPAAEGIALGGSHGLEWRTPDGRVEAPPRPAALDAASAALHAFAAVRPGTIVEDKSFGVALHYRLAPEQADAAAAETARIAAEFGLGVQPGKMMIELKPLGGDKARAVAALLEEPAMAGARPIFLGDDLTDEPGFALAAARGGWGVLVGAERPSQAHYRLPDVQGARDWLAAVAGEFA